MSLGIILLVLLIFGLLVFVHELGHFVAAKRAGVEVEEFGIGFPPRLLGKRVGDTLYSINLVPLGGFVKMKGESTADPEPGSFGAASFSNKTKILLAGVAMNALTTFVILVGLCLHGLPPLIQNQFSHGHASYAQPKQVMAVDVEPGSPAERAGLKRGDIVLRGNGQPFSSEDELVAFTKVHAGQQVSLRVAHRGSERTVQPTLRSPDRESGFLGVTPFQTYKLRYNLPDAIITAAGLTLQLMWATLTAFGGLIAGLFVHQTVSENVTGPVGIVVLLNNIVDLGWSYVLIFVASISVSLAVVNAMPLPALDGGRWLLAIVQRVTRRSLTPAKEAAVHGAGFIALLLLMAVVTYFDIKRLRG